MFSISQSPKIVVPRALSGRRRAGRGGQIRLSQRQSDSQLACVSQLIELQFVYKISINLIAADDDTPLGLQESSRLIWGVFLDRHHQRTRVVVWPSMKRVRSRKKYIFSFVGPLRSQIDRIEYYVPSSANRVPAHHGAAGEGGSKVVLLPF